MSQGIIKKYNETHIQMEGCEVVRSYFSTEKITIGMSELLPGQHGDTDYGHMEADEVFFCVEGKVLCYFEDENTYYPLHKGDALFIPPKARHQLFNIGETKATILFALAPRP